VKKLREFIRGITITRRGEGGSTRPEAGNKGAAKTRAGKGYKEKKYLRRKTCDQKEKNKNTKKKKKTHFFRRSYLERRKRFLVIARKHFKGRAQGTSRAESAKELLERATDKKPGRRRAQE